MKITCCRVRKTQVRGHGRRFWHPTGSTEGGSAVRRGRRVLQQPPRPIPVGQLPVPARPGLRRPRAPGTRPLGARPARHSAHVIARTPRASPRVSPRSAPSRAMVHSALCGRPAPSGARRPAGNRDPLRAGGGRRAHPQLTGAPRTRGRGHEYPADSLNKAQPTAVTATRDPLPSPREHERVSLAGRTPARSARQSRGALTADFTLSDGIGGVPGPGSGHYPRRYRPLV